MADPPSAGLPKLQAVARAAGVSVSTVSKVLNGRPDVAPATRTRVAELLGRAGYPDVGARGDRRGGAGGLVELVVNRLDDTMTTRLLHAVCLEAYERGMGVVVTEVESAAGRARHPPRRWLEAMDARGAEAVITLHMEFSRAQLSYFEAHGVSACTVRVDERDLGRVAVRHLLGLGHRRIAVVGGVGGVGGDAQKLVLEGCRETLNEVDAPEHATPSAIVFGGDDAARAGYAAITATGLQVPRDVSVICCGLDGLDGLDGLGGLPVTSVVQPWDEISRAALDAVSGEHRATTPAMTPAATVIAVPPRLVDRGSTAPPRTRP